MPEFSFSLNTKTVRIQADADEPLLYVLRNQIGLTGVHFGCGLGQCGACTVLVDGAPMRSCLAPMSIVKGKKIVTLEGLGNAENPHRLQKAFIDTQAVQCGYCIGGMIMSAAALLQSNAKPSTEQIHSALAGHLCRCGTQQRIVQAVTAASQT